MPDGEDTTDSTDTRWPYTNDALAVILTVAVVGLTAWALWTDGAVPLWLASVFALAASTAVVWSFGAKAVEAARESIKSE